jgi:hypothetical protein
MLAICDFSAIWIPVDTGHGAMFGLNRNARQIERPPTPPKDSRLIHPDARQP